MLEYKEVKLIMFQDDELIKFGKSLFRFHPCNSSFIRSKRMEELLKAPFHYCPYSQVPQVKQFHLQNSELQEAHSNASQGMAMKSFPNSDILVMNLCSPKQDETKITKKKM